MTGFLKAFRNSRVVLTGHTGFCGGWLSLWLRRLGAEIMGVALAPDSDPALFLETGLVDEIDHNELDICAMKSIAEKIAEFRPDYVFHLAAQPLVRRSLREPHETYRVNVMGTSCLLDILKDIDSIRAILAITTDKVYENQEWVWPYRETDALGGKDPYSASKACAELVVASYRRIYFSEPESPALITVRGGNIIGGGDWSEDRLIPDFVRAIIGDKPIVLRNPASTRPWQHVLCLCHGYLQLAATAAQDATRLSHAYNLGPDAADAIPVSEVIERLSAGWKRTDITHANAPSKEARALSIDSSLARHEIGWRPVWDIAQALDKTREWYSGFHEDGEKARLLCERQIDAYAEGLSRQ